MHPFCRFFVASSITLTGKYSYYIATLEEAGFWRPSLDPPRRNPKRPRRPEGINSLSVPPGLLVSEAMVVPVMSPAERYGELVADLASHRPGLREPQMVGIGGASPANQTRLRCDEPEMGFVTMSARLADGEFAFLNFGESSAGLKEH